MSSRDNNMPWARQNEGSPARKKIPMILSSKRHSPKKRRKSKHKQGWETSTGTKRTRNSGRTAKMKAKLVQGMQKRPWTRSLPELQDLRDEVRTMKVIEGDMIFNARLADENGRRQLAKGSLSNFQKQRDNDVYVGRLGRFPRYILFHFLTHIPIRGIDLNKWASVLDDGALAWISQVNPFLERVSLDYCNNIGDLGLTMFCKLNSNLSILSLKKVTISPHGLQAIGANSKTLKKIDLSECKYITDEHLFAMANNMMLLQALNINNCEKVTDRGIISVVKNLHGLNEISLNYLPLLTSKIINAMIGCLQNLKHLSLVGSMKNMSDAAFERFVIEMKTIMSLKIPGGVKITNYTFQSMVQKEVLYGPKPTGGLPNLVVLDVSGNNHVDDMSLSWIAAGCDGLQSFTIRHCDTNFDLGCRNFGNMRFLTYLNFSSCNGISDVGLDFLTDGGCGRRLKKLIFQNMVSVSDRSILRFLLTCTNVTDLDLSDTTNLSDKNVAITLRKLRKVTKLNVTGLPLICKHFMETIRDYCPQIYDLNISKCEKITTELLKLLQESKTIFKINISSCYGLDVNGITHVPNWRLTHLIARQLPNLKDESILSLASSHVELEYIDISYNDITSKSLNALKKKCKKLHTVNIYGCDKVKHKSIHLFSALKKHSDFCLEQGSENFYGIKRGREALGRKHMDESWSLYNKFGKSADVIACAYRTYVAKSLVYNLRLLRRRLRFKSSIVIERYVRGHLARVYVSDMKYKMTSAAYYVQYRYKKFVRNRALMKAMRFWKLGTEKYYFHSWMEWTEETVSQRQTTNKRAQERQANFFARHMFEKTWMIPILRKWNKWARDTVTARRLANDKMARAMAFFKNHTELTYFRIWKENRKIGPLRRKKLLVIFLNCVSLDSHNSTKQLPKVEKAINHYNATIRYEYRHKIFDILHQNVLDMHHAMEAARHRAVMIFRNRASHAVINTWHDYVQNRLYKRACVVRGQEHFTEVWRKIAIKKIFEHAQEKIRKRNTFNRAMKYWINSTLAKQFINWIAFIDKIKFDRAQLAKALKWFTRRLEMASFHTWHSFAKREIYNRNALRKAYAEMAMKKVKMCFKAWIRYTGDTQRLKVKLLMRWRSRELHYFFEKWWDVVGPIIQARHDAEFAAELILARENAAATEIQRIMRGYLAKLEFEREKFAVDWAVKYIQGHWRMRLARKIMKAHWRHRHLKDWKKAELEHPKMVEEERVSWELDAWWKAATFIERCYRGYIARRDMYPVRAAHQKVLIEIHNEKSQAILEEAERREEARQAEHAKKIEVTIMLQCLYRMYAARKVLQWKWQGRFYYVHAVKIQSMYRMRFAIHRAAARARWLYIRKKVRAKKWQTALLMKFAFGADTRQKQTKILKALNSVGLHPEGFVPNPFMLLKEVIFDIYYAQRAVKDMVQAWKEGGFNSYKRKKVADRIFDTHMADNLPRKGDAVQVLMNEYIRRGETGYILNVKTVNEGTNAERQLALVKFDKSGIVDWLPFKQEATAYTEVLPALTRVKTRAVKFMDVEAVKRNKVALLAYAETELELRKEYRAARLVQNAFRSRRAKSRTSVRREKVRKMTEFRIKVYKTGLRLLCFADNAWMRSVLIKQKVIRAKYLPEHMYPESSLQPKWYKEMMLKRKKRRSKAAELKVQLGLRQNRVNKANNAGGPFREEMPFKLYSEAAAARARRNDIRRSISAYPTANFFARAAGKNRFGMKYKIYRGMANIIGGPSWRQTKEQRNTWAGIYQFQNMIDSPHCTANGFAMYHGVYNRKGQPHGQGYAVFLKGEVYGIPSTKAKYKDWAFYHSIEGFFENGIPKGPVYIIYRDKSVYEGLYNGEPYARQEAAKRKRILEAKQKEKEKKDNDDDDDDDDDSNKDDNDDEKKEEENSENDTIDIDFDENVDDEEDKETRIGLLNPYEENYAFLKQGIRNRETFVKLEKVELLSPTRIKERRDATLKVDSPYKPQLESSIYSPYSRWESNLIRKPNPNLNMDEFESFVRIGTPQERFKLQLPPPLEEVITPDPTSAMVLQRRKSKKDDDSENDDSDEESGDEGFSRPGTAMTGIFSEAENDAIDKTPPDAADTLENEKEEQAETKDSDGNSVNDEDDKSSPGEEVENNSASDSEDNGEKLDSDNDSGEENAEDESVDEEENQSGSAEIEEDSLSETSSLSTRSYDEKYRDPDWGRYTSAEGERWEGYMVDNNFDPKGRDGHSGISGRFLTVDRYNETYDGDLVKGIRHGKGVYRFDDGTNYTGDWVDGKKHGHGRLEMATGEVYDGTWKDDKMHGYGVHLFADGSTFEGKYIDGKWEGYGNWVGSNGEIYNGCYKNNKREGTGRMVYENGGRYVGTFNEDLRHGQGTFYLPFDPMEEPGMRFLPNGTPTWYRDREEFKETYIGTWVKDRMDGTSLYLVDQPTNFILKRHGFWERGVLMKWVYTFPYAEATDYFCNLLKDPQMYRQAYGMSVIQKFPYLPDGVDPSDDRIPSIVKGLLKAWRQFKWEIDLIGMTLYMQYAPRVPLLNEAIETKRQAYREIRAKVLDLKEEIEEQEELVEEEKHTYEMAKAECEKLTNKIQTYWDTDEIDEDDKWEHIVKQIFEKTEEEDFRIVNKLVTAPNVVFEKMMKILCIIFYCEPDWNNARILCSDSERAVLMGDKTAITKGPFKIKFWNEIRRFNVYKLGADKERLEQIADMAYDPLLQPANRLIRGVTPAAQLMYHFIKPTLQYALQARKLLPWKRQLTTATLDLEDAKMAYEDEVDTLKAINEEHEKIQSRVTKAADEWRDVFHEAQKTIVIYEEIKRLRSGRDKNLNLGALKVDTPTSTVASSSEESGSDSSSDSSSDDSNDSSGDSDDSDSDDDSDEKEDGVFSGSEDSDSDDS